MNDKIIEMLIAARKAGEISGTWQDAVDFCAKHIKLPDIDEKKPRRSEEDDFVFPSFSEFGG